MQIGKIGQYVANICFDLSSGASAFPSKRCSPKGYVHVLVRMYIHGYVRTRTCPFPREFAPVLISSCIYTTLLAIFAPKGIRPRAFCNGDAHFTIVPAGSCVGYEPVYAAKPRDATQRDATNFQRCRAGNFTHAEYHRAFLEIINVDFSRQRYSRVR